MTFIKILKKERWTVFFYIIMLAVLFLYRPVFKSTIDVAHLIIYISFFFFAILIHFISQKDKNWFRLDVLFLLGFGIVHFQWAVMIAVSDIRPEYLSRGFIDSSYINYGTWLSTVGVLSWFVGYSWLQSKGRSIVEYRFHYKKLLWFTVMLFILFVLTAGSKFLSGGVYKGQGGSGSGEGISIYYQSIMGISILVLTLIVILDKKNKLKSSIILWLINLDKKYLILSVCYVLLFLSVGDRGAPMQIVFAFLVLFGALVRPIVLKEFIVIIIVGAIVLTLIGLGRSVDTDENILIVGANEAEFSSQYDATMQLANTARNIYSALSNVPEHHDFFWGKLWLGRILGLVPFAQNLYEKFTDDNYYELNSSRYLTYSRFGRRPYSGEGTVLIADIYLNFGSIGVMFFMLLLGLFFKKTQNELGLQRSFYWLITATVLASFGFYMGRSHLFIMAKPIIWGIFLAVLFVRRKKVIQ